MRRVQLCLMRLIWALTWACLRPQPTSLYHRSYFPALLATSLFACSSQLLNSTGKIIQYCTTQHIDQLIPYSAITESEFCPTRNINA